MEGFWQDFEVVGDILHQGDIIGSRRLKGVEMAAPPVVPHPDAEQANSCAYVKYNIYTKTQQLVRIRFGKQWKV